MVWNYCREKSSLASNVMSSCGGITGAAGSVDLNEGVQVGGSSFSCCL